MWSNCRTFSYSVVFGENVSSRYPFWWLTLRPLCIKSIHVAIIQTCVSSPAKITVSMGFCRCKLSKRCSTSPTNIVNWVLEIGCSCSKHFKGATVAPRPWMITIEKFIIDYSYITMSLFAFNLASSLTSPLIKMRLVASRWRANERGRTDENIDTR